MKNLLPLLLYCLLLMNVSFAQEIPDKQAELLDVKVKLLDSKMELLDIKMETWEKRPDYLTELINELKHRIRTLEDMLKENQYSLYYMDSVLNMHQQKIEKLGVQRPFLPSVRPEEDIMLKEVSTVIGLNPVRLFEGSFQLSYEKAINSRMSFEISGLATYASREGLSSFYIKNQEFNYFDHRSNTFKPYTGENIEGFGISLEFKNYLLAAINPRQYSPVGLYAAPQMMMRRVFLTGTERVFMEETWEEKEITQRLNIYTAGVVLGYKIRVIKVLSVDAFVGGIIRLSKYDHEGRFTRYRPLGNIDYSGVVPTAGLKIGIVK